MSDELKDKLNDQFTLLNLMKVYLIDEKTMLINNGIERIFDGGKIFRHELKNQESEFRASIENDFNLMINYCENLDIKPIKKRKIIQGFERIYNEFYSNLYLYINHEEEEIQKMIQETFDNFSKNNFQ